MKIYYAHCIALYNSAQEQRDLIRLEALGFEIVNPNCKECSDGYKAEGMYFFKQYAQLCDAVAFRATPGGGIPAGVATEVGWFADEGKPIIELPSMIADRTMSVESTREYLREVGHR